MAADQAHVASVPRAGLLAATMGAQRVLDEHIPPITLIACHREPVERLLRWVNVWVVVVLIGAHIPTLPPHPPASIHLLTFAAAVCTVGACHAAPSCRRRCLGHGCVIAGWATSLRARCRGLTWKIWPRSWSASASAPPSPLRPWRCPPGPGAQRPPGDDRAATHASPAQGPGRPVAQPA